MPPASNITSDEKRVCKAFDSFLVDFYRREKEPPADLTFKGSPGRRSRRSGHINTQKMKEADVLFDRVDWLPRIKSVHEVTHSFGPKKIMEEAASSMRLGSKQLFRWIHVPANNVRSQSMYFTYSNALLSVILDCVGQGKCYPEL